MQITHVDALPFGHYLGMRRQKEPCDMREKESTASIVRIGIRFRVFVVNAVIVSPCVCIALKNRKMEIWLKSTVLHLVCTLSLTCPDIVNKNVRIKRNCHVALYALCDQSR